MPSTIKPGDISNATMETMNLVENDIWEPLNATNGRNMDQAISEALAKQLPASAKWRKSDTAVTRKNAPQGDQPGMSTNPLPTDAAPICWMWLSPWRELRP